jgi:hypothetical protein
MLPPQYRAAAPPKYFEDSNPLSNRAVEHANSLIFTAIKKNLEGQKKGKWEEELSKVIWSHNTIASRAINFTPFNLMFEEVAVTSEEIKFQNARTMVEATPCPTEQDSKDLLESERLKAVEDLTKYQKETKAWRDQKVK